jgi:hypothetical protein
LTLSRLARFRDRCYGPCRWECPGMIWYTPIVLSCLCGLCALSLTIFQAVVLLLVRKWVVRVARKKFGSFVLFSDLWIYLIKASETLHLHTKALGECCVHLLFKSSRVRSECTLQNAVVYRSLILYFPNCSQKGVFRPTYYRTRPGHHQDPP